MVGGRKSSLRRLALLNGGFHYVITLLFCLGIAISVLAFNGLKKMAFQQIEKQFKSDASERISVFNQVLMLNLSEVESLGVVYNTFYKISHSQFQRFVAQFMARSPAIKALEWVPRVDGAQKNNFEKAVRAEGSKEFQITERAAQGNIVPAADRAEYFPVTFVEPMKGNELALGYDIASNPVRWEVLKSSRDLGELRISGRITLVQEDQNHFGFLATFPVYRTPLPILSLQEKREKLQGFIVGPFRVADILNSAVGQLRPLDISLALFDRSAEKNNQYLAGYSTARYPSEDAKLKDIEGLMQAELHHSENFEIGGRQWQIIAVPGKDYYAGYSEYAAWSILIFGFTITTMLTLYILLIQRRYQEIKGHVEKSHAAESLLKYQASHDALTDLVNRTELEKRLKFALINSQETGVGSALLYMDLDQFKTVNDTCGHAAGDELLKQITATFKQQTRSRDTLARLGGDEFALLLEHCSVESAEEIANKLIHSVKNHRFSWQKKTFKIGVSIGIVSITATSKDIQQVLSAADMACYKAKELGRSCMHTYVEGNSDLYRDKEMHLAALISNAIEKNKLVLFYQSLKALDGINNEESIKIHFRLRDENGQWVPSTDIATVAQRHDLMKNIDLSVLKNTLTFFTQNMAALESLNLVYITLSSQSLEEGDFLAEVVGLLENIDQSKDNKFPPQKLCFEISEDVVVANPDAVMAFTTALKFKGCCFALSDFGLGSLSYNHLKQLPVDYLKIDAGVLREIGSDSVSCAIAKSIVEIAAAMGMKTIAESAASDRVLAIIKDIGVDYVQRYNSDDLSLLEQVVPGFFPIKNTDSYSIRPLTQ